MQLEFLSAKCRQEVSDKFQALLWYLSSHGSPLQRLDLWIDKGKGNLSVGRLSGPGPHIPNFQAVKHLTIYSHGQGSVNLFVPRYTLLEQIHIEAKTVEIELAEPDSFLMQMVRLGCYYHRMKKKCMRTIIDALERAAEKKPRVQYETQTNAAIREEGRACSIWRHAFIAHDASIFS